MNTRRLTIVVGAALVAALSSPASADLQQRKDPQGDVAGGRLDLRRVGLDHTDKRLAMRVLTWTRWSKAALEGGEEDLDRIISWAFDSRGGSDLDYGVVVDSEGGELVAYLVRVVPGQAPERLGNINSLRRDGKFVEVTLRRSRMNTRPGYVRWAAQTIWDNETTCDLPCYDFRPEQPDVQNPTLLRHDL